MGGTIARTADVFNSSQCTRSWLPALLPALTPFYVIVEATLPRSLPGLFWLSDSDFVRHLTSCELVILQAATR